MTLDDNQRLEDLRPPKAESFHHITELLQQNIKTLTQSSLSGQKSHWEMHYNNRTKWFIPNIP
jgi:hypothetical protein